MEKRNFIILSDDWYKLLKNKKNTQNNILKIRSLYREKGIKYKEQGVDLNDKLISNK